MRCPEGGDCFDVLCIANGCQGFQVEVEAITVVRTSIRRRRARVAAVSLVAGFPAPSRPLILGWDLASAPDETVLVDALGPLKLPRFGP